MTFDLSLYLVTDSTPAILGDRDLIRIVDEAIQGGVTIVQYRDKHSETSVLIDTAKKIHKVTRKHGVPLLVNDRIDVALAIGAEGVHLGQDDTPIQDARRILGEEAIIGISSNTVEEAKIAIEAGADYLGIGAVFGTPTKSDTKSLLGPIGLQDFLSAISFSPIPTVAIGGINPKNASRVLYQSSSPSKSISGIAVVSAIITATDPKAVSSQLKYILTSPPTHKLVPSTSLVPSSSPTNLSALIANVPSLLSHHHNLNPLSHNMTNTVVQNFAANVCLSTSSSPIMSLSGPEAHDLSLLRGGLVINMGTLTPDLLTSYLQGALAYNSSGNPIVFDPVGGGATALRRSAVRTLMSGSYFSVIKGNESEIQTVYNTSFSLTSTTSAQKGVDSAPSTTTPIEKAQLVKSLARREKSIILLTGPTDYLSDGTVVLSISNGHPYLGKITGSGCALGAVIAGFCASARDLAEKSSPSPTSTSPYLLATLTAVLLYEIAAEYAVESGKCFGPGSFIPAFLDQLYRLTSTAEDSEADNDKIIEWLDRAKVEVLDV
ncbi:putative thiamine biosynthetic bifunctional [Phaeomoniella chlamydospora]|uniref:Putative thiamine biosynthetic bifunctional n=1 Tax=Phaeomoniella chlamydospora TaxID=158046 RepID=A0A0G2DYE9_PHACM|nr:putative thiamine biosynthetic bifunctional [Phaeomoniella chlamydospora]